MKKPKPIKIKKGQESVWDYPRPPKLESFHKAIEVYFDNTLIASSIKTYRVLETSHPPVYYIPPGDISMEYLIKSDKTTYCEFKGQGSYYDIQLGTKKSKEIAWYYTDPRKDFMPIKNYLAFYADKVDRCTVDGVEVLPQPGDFYGGWITPNIIGPFKGVPGSWGW